MKGVLDVWDGRLTGLLAVSFFPDLWIIKSLLILEHFKHFDLNPTASIFGFDLGCSLCIWLPGAATCWLRSCHKDIFLRLLTAWDFVLTAWIWQLVTQGKCHSEKKLFFLTSCYPTAYLPIFLVHITQEWLLCVCTSEQSVNRQPIHSWGPHSMCSLFPQRSV